MQQQVNPFMQYAMQLHQQIHPLFQQSLQHRQVMLGEFTKIVSISQNLIPICDDIVLSINSGNAQRALASAQNLRGMSEQLIQSAQFLNNGIAQRMDMALYMLSMAQQRINELSGAIQSARPQIGFISAPYHQTAPAYMS